MTSVLHDETNIMFLSKCKRSNDVFRRRDIDGVFDITPNDALIIDLGEWIAALVEKYRCHDGRRIFFAVRASHILSEMAGTIDLLERRLMPLFLHQVALFSIVIVTMARSSNGDGMDEASIDRSVEAIPCCTARPGRIIWHSFTAQLRCRCIAIPGYLSKPQGWEERKSHGC